MAFQTPEYPNEVIAETFPELLQPELSNEKYTKTVTRLVRRTGTDADFQAAISTKVAAILAATEDDYGAKSGHRAVITQSLTYDGTQLVCLIVAHLYQVAHIKPYTREIAGPAASFVGNHVTGARFVSNSTLQAAMNLVISGSDYFTLVFHVRRNQTERPEELFSAWTGDFTDSQILCGFTAAGEFQVTISSNATDRTAYKTGASFNATNTFYRIFVVFDKTAIAQADKVRVYLTNNELALTTTVTGAGISDVISTTLMYQVFSKQQAAAKYSDSNLQAFALYSGVLSLAALDSLTVTGCLPDLAENTGDYSPDDLEVYFPAGNSVWEGYRYVWSDFYSSPANQFISEEMIKDSLTYDNCSNVS